MANGSARLEGKRIVLTGAGSGIGRASALRFAAEGARVYAVDLTQGVDDTVAQIHAAGGVRINAICPGLIETGMTAPLFERARDRGTEGRIGQLNPLRRAGRPEEIAAMATFLLSDDASDVDGQAFAVDGGLSASHPFVPPKP